MNVSDEQSGQENSESEVETPLGLESCKSLAALKSPDIHVYYAYEARKLAQFVFRHASAS